MERGSKFKKTGKVCDLYERKVTPGLGKDTLEEQQHEKFHVFAWTDK